MRYSINPKFLALEKRLLTIISNFDNQGEVLVKGQRNSIKLFTEENLVINIKSFKKPNLVNKFVYRFFRKSKAQRSYEFALELLKKGIGTPNPIGYFENRSLFTLQDSYYACEHLKYDLTYRELVETDYPDADNILRQFTQFTYMMHQKGVEFLDHSPGNTLIQNKGNGKYEFFLVDLNRMKFHESIDFKTRMKNLSKITPHKEMVAVMSNEYAKLSGESEQLVFNTMWQLTEDFQYRFYRKKRIKKKLKFWKK
ncbi:MULTISPECIES: Kdo domain containing protein [Flavobacterium]|uniref:Lipopolysaccharide kinase InaA family protein n=1 Tax=Flavobacterium hankyongi TaxID=1176532 RepID=A0ABP9AAF0_9FLAO|nr:Kdo domain containing protein [Flavobacterium sp. N1846]